MKSIHTHFRFLACIAISLAISTSAIAVGLNDKLGGYSLDDLAKAFATHGDIRANYGEGNEDGPFNEFLQKEFGSDVYGYHTAYQLWHEEWEKDESGQLEARFSTLMSKYHIALQMDDTKDMSQEQREGVTLETYAKAAVAMTQQPNADIDAILKEHGISDQAKWQKASEAWVQAMSQDGIIATQYGLLYQKYAGAGFAAEQEQRLANQLGGRRNEEIEDVEDDDTQESGVAFYAQELSSTVKKDRWYAANRMLFHCSRFRDWGDDDGEGLAVHCSDDAIDSNIVPVVKELLTTFDNDNVEAAATILDSVVEMKLQQAVGKESVITALKRAQLQHSEIKAKYEPVQFKNVPEKAKLRFRMDATASSIEDFGDQLSDW